MKTSDYLSIKILLLIYVILALTFSQIGLAKNTSNKNLEKQTLASGWLILGEFFASWLGGKVLDAIFFPEDVRATTKDVLQYIDFEKERANKLTGEEYNKVMSVINEAEKVFKEFDNYISTRQMTDEEMRNYCIQSLNDKFIPLEKRVNYLEVELNNLEKKVNVLGTVVDSQGNRITIVESKMDEQGQINITVQAQIDSFKKATELQAYIGAFGQATNIEKNELNFLLEEANFESTGYETLLLGGGVNMSIWISRIVLIEGFWHFLINNDVTLYSNKSDRDTLNIEIGGNGFAADALYSFQTTGAIGLDLGLGLMWNNYVIRTYGEEGIEEKYDINRTYPFIVGGFRAGSNNVFLISTQGHTSEIVLLGTS